MKNKDKDTIKKPKENVKEIIVEKQIGFNYAEVIVVIIISLIVGVLGGYFVNKFTSHTKTTIITKEGTKVSKEFDEFINTYYTLLNNYYKDIDSKELLNAGINGMLEYLDDFSVYMNPSTTEDFNEQVEGKYEGIGVEIIQNKEKKVVITRVFENSPAAKAGLKVNDIFKSVDGLDVSSKLPSEISELIRSKTGKIKIVVERNNEEKEFILSLGSIDIESVYIKTYEKNNKKIGYIGITIFASNTYDQFKQKLKELEKEKIDGLVIDVRNNNGGYLSVVTDMVSMFLPKNKIVYQLDTKGVVEQIYSKTKESRSYPVTVLINELSASASEILASSLQESYGAKVVGVNSFGKGTVNKCAEQTYQTQARTLFDSTISKLGANGLNGIGNKLAAKHSM